MLVNLLNLAQAVQHINWQTYKEIRYSEMLTFIISSTCLKTSFPEGSAGSDSNDGLVHGLSLLPPAGLLPLIATVHWFATMLAF